MVVTEALFVSRTMQAMEVLAFLGKTHEAVNGCMRLRKSESDRAVVAGGQAAGAKG